jgi:uncharacterized protein (DUF58 family)
MIRPRYRACALMTVLLVGALASEAWGGRLGWLLLGGFVVISAVDIAWAARVQLSGFERHLPEQLAIGCLHPVSVTLHNPHPYAVRLSYHECLGGNAAARTLGLPARLKVPARHQARFQYRLQPMSRGPLVFTACELQVSGPLGLWEVRHRLAAPQRSRAGPNLARLSALAGERYFACVPRRGPDLVIWLDTGPALGGLHQGQRPLDHATDAILAVACAALARGARVALHFDGNPNRRYLAAAGGDAQLHALSQAVANLQASAHPMAWRASAVSLMQHSHRDDLVLLITRLPTNDTEVLAPLSEVARERRLVIADIVEQPLLDMARQPLRNEAQARAYCGVIQALGPRQRASAVLAAAGLEVLHVPGQGLAQALVERYARSLLQAGR